MKRISSALTTLLLACLAWIAPFAPANACESAHRGWRLPTTPVSYVTSEKYPGDAFLDIRLTGVPRNCSVNNSTYPGWCTQVYNWDLTPGFTYSGARLWLSTDPALPEHLKKPWGSINYLLNNKSGMPQDVQCAIWYLTDGYVLPEEQQTPAYVSLIQAACAQTNFLPRGNQLTAVILDLGPESAPQRLFIEVASPPSNPGTRLPGYWKKHPEAWPVDSIRVGAFTYGKEEAIALMRTPAHGDKTYPLACQLIAAKLNILIGNDPACISSTIQATDLFLTWYPVGSGLSGGRRAFRRWGEALLDTLKCYNEGQLLWRDRCGAHQGRW